MLCYASNNSERERLKPTLIGVECYVFMARGRLEPITYNTLCLKKHKGILLSKHLHTMTSNLVFFSRIN